MIFKQLTINNFLSYFNKNEIDFSPLTTIFIGQNNTGKSKLFDAINFVIYGRIYDTQKESWITNDKEISALILNKHRINEGLKNNEKSITSGVSLVVDEISLPNTLLQIERSYLFNFNEEKQTYEYSSKKITLNEIDKLEGTPTVYLGQDALDRLIIYFSESIKDFFLFQGEAASKIMQLRKGGNFRNAVREIARLELFEKATNFAEKYTNTISKSITMKNNKSKRDKEQKEKLQKDIDVKQELIDEYTKDINNNENAIIGYEEIIEKCNKELAQLKEFEEYFQKKQQNEQDRKKLQLQIKEIDNDKSSLAEESIFYKVKDKIKSFKTFYSQLEKKGEVPPSSPQHEIRKALDCCRCTICNSDLSEGTETRRFAESRLLKCDTDKLGGYLRSLDYTLGDMGVEVLRVPKKLEELLKNKKQLEDRKASLVKKEEYLSSLLNNTEISQDSSQEKIKHIDDLKKTINHYTHLREKARNDNLTSTGSKNVYEKQLKEAKQKLDSLIIDDEDIDENDKIKLYYSGKLNKIMKDLFELANKTAYEQVEQKANEYYKEMTHENAALVGDIKIDLETSEIYTVDENGSPIVNINQGNRISIQLAVIAGILTVAQEQFDVLYPFVTDAPVSHLGGDNKRSTIETMINAFEQSVIIIKDDISSVNKENDEIRQLINDSNDIEYAYELSLSEADTIAEQYTVVKQIKG